MASLILGLFKGKSKREKLNKRYAALLEESHRLSTVDRKASDLKRAEAEAVLKQIEQLEAEEG